ncbi:hypothetical protein H257_19029 [Aphanomyces astaci]|uniref:Uncharacterized protein n=1 Tax=Aphanomyces astaci TaxID=112090 RepID=W4F9A0_APHAT|nr:hypothetical protein H257_19029 [Aphanomyces astaci]ETV64032.1 hypothetical protein H257_19029 [Aphanomyces astaci]|eukprot:XP_009846485.1 hypothetical protein H257_19029 [Aphanomyces astaci]
MDKEMGVAVVFDGDDQEEGSDNDEIRDDDDDGDELMREGMRLIDWMMNEGINGGLDDIDAFWLQREQGAHGSSKRSRMRSDLRSSDGAIETFKIVYMHENTDTHGAQVRRSNLSSCDDLCKTHIIVASCWVTDTLLVGLMIKSTYAPCWW